MMLVCGGKGAGAGVGAGAGAGAVDDEVVAAAGSTSPGPVELEGDLGGTEGTEWPWFNDFSVDKAEPSRLFFLLPGGAKVRFGGRGYKFVTLPPVTYTRDGLVV